ncbi:hypothetical protein GDO81_010716 [Engystomops pustulosus]|uniref:BED-type domain-containing protein n=1 Tax=Engystomops pustulosus TaxID=76066 RepID=A0AAV7C2C4_ENGPU|nr:hypothetical protein GDO81_010716 [Engystomops pustulosus]
MSWIADNASSHLSTSQSSTQSTHVTEISTPPAPPPQPPSPQSAPSQQNLAFEPAYSEELFSGPFPQSQTTCPVAAELFSDAQVFHRSQSVGDDDIIDVVEEVCKEVSDDEETRLSDSGEVVVRAGSPRGEQTEGSEDDEVTDPSWLDRPGEHSASETEASPIAEQVGRGSGGARRRGRARAGASAPNVSRRQAPVARARFSEVWRFFKETPDDRRTVVCNLCQTRISRGSTTTSLSTTSMRRHMNAKHPTQWHQAHSPPAGHTTAPSPTLERKRKYSATHPHAQALNVHISKLLSLEMLPYRLVETEAFRNLMAAAAPRYSVPSRHYFSRCADPALHKHVSEIIIRALTNAVSDKVHLTTDTWTSAAGQGHNISLTAHWVNLVEAGTESDAGAGHILPTSRIAGPTSVQVSKAYYASSSELPSVGMAPSVGSSRHSSSAVA